MTKRKAKAEGESSPYPEIEAYFAEHPGPYASLQSAADAYYGQATTDEQRAAVELYADVSEPPNE